MIEVRKDCVVTDKKVVLDFVAFEVPLFRLAPLSEQTMLFAKLVLIAL